MKRILYLIFLLPFLAAAQSGSLNGTNLKLGGPQVTDSTKFTNPGTNWGVLRYNPTSSIFQVSENGGTNYRAAFPGLFSSTARGLVPASGGGSTNVLHADGTWAAVSSGISGLTTDYVIKATSSTTIGNSIIYENSGSIGIGTISPDRILHSEIDDANNNTITYPLRLTHTTSGTPANGIGTGLEFEIETSSSNNEIGGVVRSVVNSAVAGNENIKLHFDVMNAGVLGEAFRIETYNSGATSRLTMQGSFIDATSSLVSIVKTTAIAGGLKVSSDPSALAVIRLDVEENAASTNVILPAARFTAVSSGTPAAGIGASLQLGAETTPSNIEIGSIIESVTTDITSTSEDFDLVFKTMAAGATASERLRVSSARSTFTTPIKPQGYTVATLPAGVIGDHAYATDLLAPTFGATAVGGGSVVLPVFFDGTNWVVH